MIKLLYKPNLNFPAKAHEDDAGFDVLASQDPRVVGSAPIMINGTNFYKSIDYIEYKTNLQIELNPEYWFGIFPRSSNRKYNLSLCNSVGVADPSYRGEYLVCFKYLFQPEDYFVAPDGNLVGKINYKKIYQKGDKIAQLILQKRADLTENFEFVDWLSNTERADGGHGSTGQ